MSDRNYYAVIMAGGGGTRLWPLSRRSRPKQLLELVGNTSMFAMAVNRLRDILPVERILVVTIADQAAMLQQNVPEIPKENYLIEPMPRGTASVVGLAAVKLQKIDPQATMAVLTADHYIRNIPLFHELLEFGWATAQDDWLVTLASIRPSLPPVTVTSSTPRRSRNTAPWRCIACSSSRKNRTSKPPGPCWPAGTTTGIQACSSGKSAIS